MQKTPDCFFEILFSTIKRLHAIVEWLMSGNALATKFSSSDPDANVFSTTGRNATTEGNIGKIGSEQSIGGRDTRSNAAAVHSSGGATTMAELAAEKKKRTAQQIMNSAVQKWWFAAIGLVLGLVSFGFGIAMALRSERIQRARSVAEKALQQRTDEFTRIATDFVSAIDEQEARVRDNIDRLDKLQHYWVAALEDNQRIAEQTYNGVRQLQQHLRAPNVLPPLRASSFSM